MLTMKRNHFYYFIGALFLIPTFLGGLLVLTLTVAEYKPAEIEPLKVGGKANFSPSIGEEINILSWNIGYLSLGEKADFFMDGGKMVRALSEDYVKTNLFGVGEELKKGKHEIILLQEVDKKSYRSYGIEEVEELSALFPAYDNSYARNFKVLFIPYPYPPIRDVDAGLLTLSAYRVGTAERHSLYSPFNWPVKLVNLKRCLLINRIPLKNSEKELVTVNLHLEAYDDTGGAMKQYEEMLDFMKGEVKKGNYVVAGGDFNQTFSNVKTEGTGSYGKDTWRPKMIEVKEDDFFYLMDGDTPSCRSLERIYDGREDFPKYVIDGFIVSKNIEVKEFHVLPLNFKHSDHNPVHLKIKLK